MSNPFQIGTEVVATRWYNGRLVLGAKAKVSKIYKNGNIRLIFDHSGKEASSQFKVSRNYGSDTDAADPNNWSLHECGRSIGGASYKIVTPWLLGRAEEGETKKRMEEVEKYLSGRLAQRNTNLSAEQLARINAILNEETN